jgi:hypothetical protein
MVVPQVGLLAVVNQNGVGRGMRAEEVDDIFLIDVVGEEMWRWDYTCTCP